MNMNDLQGKKTYIVAVFAALVTLARFLEFIDDETYQMLLGLLGAGGIATIAAKGNRIDKKAEQLETKTNIIERKMIVFLFAILGFAGFSGVANAQTPTATLEYTYLNTTLVEVNTYQQVITINSIVLTTVPTCVLSGTNTVCSVAAPQLATGSHTVSIAATKNGVTAETKITGLGATGGPTQPGSPKVKITVTISIS